MLNAENLSFRYRGGPEVLRKVSFSLEDGQFLAILGNNGAGKSTMLKCFNQILRVEGGHVWMDGEDLLTMPHREVARRVAFVSQNIPSTQMTVHDVVMLGRRPYMRWGFTEEDHRIVHEAMDRLNLSDMRGRFLSELSGGERQKVMLARALAQQPRVLLLDEPTSSLDLRSQYEVLGLVSQLCREQGITAVAVLHDLNLALRFCHRFLLLHGGRVYAQGDASVVSPRAIREVYGMEAAVRQVDGVPVVLPTP